VPHPLKITIPPLLVAALGAGLLDVQVSVVQWLILYVGTLSAAVLWSSGEEPG
jgi:hypothetical protein